MAKTSRKYSKRKQQLADNEMNKTIPTKKPRTSEIKHLTTHQKRAFKKEKARIRKQNSINKLTTSQKDTCRLKDKQRKKVVREQMTLKQKSASRNKAKKGMQLSRARMIPDQLVASRDKAKKGMKLSRARMTPDQLSASRDKAKKGMKLSRAKMTRDQLNLNRDKAKKGMQDSRAAMTPNEIAAAKTKNKKAKQLYRVKKSCLFSIQPYSTYFDENIIPVHDIGLMSAKCKECDAYMFEIEKHDKFNAYSLCCNYGKVKILPIKPPPIDLQELFTEPDTKAKEFRKNIRQYNSALALASVGIDLGKTVSCTYSSGRHCSGLPIGRFPPISHEFLTPQSSVQIY